MNPGKILSAETDTPGPCKVVPDARTANNTVRNVALQQGLRAAYRTVIEEPLPDRLLALLQQLDGDGPAR